jgi:hypothetical protein
MKNLRSGSGIKLSNVGTRTAPEWNPKREGTKPRAGPPKGHMVDIMLFAMVIASAVSLLVVSPRQAQKTLRALTEYHDMEPTHAYGPNEDSTKMEQPAVVQRAKSA